MALELTEKHGSDRVRLLSALEEAALRAVKGGNAAPSMREIYRRTSNHVRDRDLWILCDCRREETAKPVIVPRRVAPGRVLLVNLPDASVPHAEGCVFAPRGAGEEQPPRLPDRSLNPFPDRAGHSDRPEPGIEPRRPWTPPLGAGRDPPGVAHILKTFIQAARLNTLAGSERFASPVEWLGGIRRAAERFHVAPNLPASEVLFTDPADWHGGEVGARLAAAERRWPERSTPCGFLCWLAHDVSDHEINRDHRESGHVWAAAGVASPIVHDNRVSGPYLFLGAVARSDDGLAWECRMACAQPIVSAQCPIPVESDYERRAVESLRHLVGELRSDAGLHEALGGAVRVELQKPLFPFRVPGGPCLPDVLITAIRPGGRGHLPGNPDDANRGGPYADPDRARYVIEVMGFRDPQYEAAKEETHSRMRRIGRVIRMEGPQFDSPHNGIERQRGRIAKRIAKDLAWRWTVG